MRPFCIVVAPPLFNDDLSLFHRVEDFAVQQFIPHSCVKAFDVSVLPRGAWRDVSRLSANSRYPIADGVSYELWAVVRTNEVRHTAHDEEVGQRINHVRGIEAPFDTDCQTFTAELIKYVQCTESLSIVSAVMHKVIRPDMVYVFCSQANT